MIASLFLLAAAATESEPGIREIGTFAADNLPLVIGFHEALEARDQGAMRSYATENLLIEPLLGRLLEENKALDFQDLYDFSARCTPTGQLGNNHVSITVHYSCSEGMRGRMVFNFDNGKIERVSIGELPDADVVRVYPKDREN